jgi:hypothetical protein
VCDDARTFSKASTTIMATLGWKWMSATSGMSYLYVTWGSDRSTYIMLVPGVLASMKRGKLALCGVLDARSAYRRHMSYPCASVVCVCVCMCVCALTRA